VTFFIADNEHIFQPKLIPQLVQKKIFFIKKRETFEQGKKSIRGGKEVFKKFFDFFNASFVLIHSFIHSFIMASESNYDIKRE
jgi:hypothetical protein